MTVLGRQPATTVLGAPAIAGGQRRLPGAGPFDIGTALLLIAGAALRLQQPDLVLFKFDEATAAEQVNQMLRTHTPIPAGTESSVGALFPPLFDDLMLPPFLISHNPVLATAYVAAINVAALLLAVLLVRRYAGPRAAFLTAALYALSPWAVVYSRKIWDPYVIALFAVLAFWGLLALLIDTRGWGGALAVFGWLWLMQLHPSAVLLAPVGLVALWLGRRSLRPLSLLCAVIVGALPLLPYLWFERENHWRDLHLFLQSGAATVRLNGDAILYPVQNATGVGATQLEDVPLAQFLHPLWLAPTLSWVGVALLVVGLAGATGAAVGLWRGRRMPPGSCAFPARPDRRVALYLLPLCWLAVPTVLALRSTTPLVPHYFMTLLPVTFIAMALGLDALCRLRPAWTPAIVGGASVYALAATAPLLALLAYLPTPAAAGFQYLRYSGAVERVVDRLTPGGPVDLMGLDSDTATALAYLLQGKHAVAATADTWALLSSGAPVQALIGPPTGTIAGSLFPASSAAAPVTIDAAGAAITVVPVTGGGEATALRAMRPLDVRLANGVRYLGWSATQPRPDLLRVTVGWRLDALLPAAATDDYAPYVHLVQGGRIVAQHDGIPFPSARWQVGDVIYAWFDLPLPSPLAAGEYELRTGMYTRPAVRRIARLGPTGPEDGEFALGFVRLLLGS